MKITMLILLLCMAFSGGLLLKHALSPRETVQLRDLQIKDIRRLSKLLCIEADLQAVREYSIEGYTGTIKCILIIYGVRQIGIDLNKAEFISQDADKKEAVLLLPPPEVTSVRLDHQRSEVYRIDRSGLWLIVPGNSSEVKLVNKALKQAEEELKQKDEQERLLPQSQDQAEQLIQGFGEALGWNIKVQWADGPAAP